jgi:hypothetical protein
VQDKYGWFALRQNIDAENKMAVAGATATVTAKDEPAEADA